MQGFGMQIVNSGDAVVLDSTRAKDAYAADQTRQTNQREALRKEAKEIEESTYEEMVKATEEAEGRDQDYINEVVISTRDQLASAIEGGMSETSPEYMRLRREAMLNMKQQVEKSKAYQEQVVMTGKYLEESQAGKYIRKGEAYRRIEEENAKPLNERDPNLLKSILEGDEFYDIEAEGADIAYKLEKTNFISKYNNENALNTEHRAGYEYNKEEKAWELSQEIEDQILNGDLGSPTFQAQITKKAKKLVDSGDIKSLEAAKRKVLNDVMSKHAGVSQEIEGLKQPARPSTTYTKGQAEEQDITYRAERIMQRDRVALNDQSVRNSKGQPLITFSYGKDGQIIKTTYVYTKSGRFKESKDEVFATYNDIEGAKAAMQKVKNESNNKYEAYKVSGSDPADKEGEVPVVEEGDKGSI